MSYPEVRILQLVEGAKQARGLTVVIDVCRSFTNSPYLVSKGIEEIYPVSTVEEAFELKKLMPDAIVVGEVGGHKVGGFDFGNSPSESLAVLKIETKRAIYRSSAGTQGLVSATNADELLAGSFVCANAIVRYVQKICPDVVSLVCMGTLAEREAIEDTTCAEYIRAKIFDQEVDLDALFQRIWESETGEKFRDPKRPHMPEQDLKLCLQVDVFGFILRCKTRQPRLCMEKVDV